jgi:hypothetical protein
MRSKYSPNRSLLGGLKSGIPRAKFGVLKRVCDRASGDFDFIAPVRCSLPLQSGFLRVAILEALRKAAIKSFVSVAIL